MDSDVPVDMQGVGSNDLSQKLLHRLHICSGVLLALQAKARKGFSLGTLETIVKLRNTTSKDGIFPYRLFMRRYSPIRRNKVSCCLFQGALLQSEEDVPASYHPEFQVTSRLCHLLLPPANTDYHLSVRNVLIGIRNISFTAKIEKQTLKSRELTMMRMCVRTWIAKASPSSLSFSRCPSSR